MNILDIEKAIFELVSEFCQDPFRFFTEADAVARFHTILEQQNQFGNIVGSMDEYKIPLIHQEFPTFFRFDDDNPVQKLDPPARRCHYDLVVLNPDFIKKRTAVEATNRQIIDLDGEDGPAIFAAVEFKLDPIGWSKGRTRGIGAEFGKLALSSDDIEHRYQVALMRYTAPTMTRWDKYWDQVKQTAKTHNEINSNFAVCWCNAERRGHEIFSFGDWQVSWGNK